MATPKPGVDQRRRTAMATTTMIPTITEVIQVSFRLVQVILRASARTSRKNLHRVERLLAAARRTRRRAAGFGRAGCGSSEWRLDPWP